MECKMSRPLLEMKNINKKFAGVAALTNANLEIFPGEIHALVGQNGAGKSTLIKILTGYYSRDTGEINYDGQSINFKSPREAQLNGISTIYQEINLVGYRSITENICLGRKFSNWGFLDWKTMRSTARELLAKFQINIDVDQPLENFSTAIQQMVAIARAVGFASKLVIMDEPTSSLDDREVDVLFGVIRKLKEQGISVIFVSHKIDELFAICDRITILRDGLTVRSGSMSQMNRFELVASMLGRDINTVKRSGSTSFGKQVFEKKETLIEVSHIKSAPRVRDVSLSINRGEIVGLAGLLGSGRSETARLIFGAGKKQAGKITLKGQSFDPKRPKDAIDAGIGFCTEDRKTEGIIPDLSVQENITLAFLPKLTKFGFVDKNAQYEIAQQFVDKLKIKCSNIEQPIKQLSGGNQQKVLLARWLCMNPELLILDEPTRGIDVGAKAEVQGLIGNLAKQGLSVLMVSSEIEEIFEGAHKAFVLRDGKKVAELSGEDLDETHLLHAMAHGDTTFEGEILK